MKKILFSLVLSGAVLGLFSTRAQAPFNEKYSLAFDMLDYTNLIGSRVFVHNASGLVRTVTFTNSPPTNLTTTIPMVQLMGSNDAPGLYLFSAQAIDKLGEVSEPSTNFITQFFLPPLAPIKHRLAKNP